jgi:hypothetical protein
MILLQLMTAYWTMVQAVVQLVLLLWLGPQPEKSPQQIICQLHCSHSNSSQ